MKQGRYKRRSSDINSNFNLHNHNPFASPNTHTGELRTLEEFKTNKVLMGTRSLEEHGDEASELKS